MDRRLALMDTVMLVRASQVVQGEVELEHVDARLAEEAEGATVGVLVDETKHRGGGGGDRRIGYGREVETLCNLM